MVNDARLERLLKIKYLFLPLALLLLAGCTCLAQPREAASRPAQQPKTVRDFFLALPERFFSLDCCLYNRSYKAAKREYLKRYLKVEDAANGYMSGSGDAAQEGFEMALFKRPNGTYLIAFYTHGEGGLEDTPWCVFLDYKNGKWSDVSRQVVPNYSKEKYEYDLPRYGTTISVYQKVEEGEQPKLYDLIWKNGTFSIVR